jgi:tRNA(fMet)-specific endonuclease VapC
MFLADTNIISELVRKKPNKRIIRWIEKNAEEIFTASPVWHELNYGALRLPDSKRKEMLQKFLQEVVLCQFPILPYDEKAAALHAHERAQLERTGKHLPYVDGQIGAIALSRGLKLATRNKDDFKEIHGLEVISF